MQKQGEIFRMCCPNCARHLSGIKDEKGCVKIICERCDAKIVSKHITPTSCNIKITAQ
ncbi:MAG: hypothetical protein LUI60_03955 [Clostridia bacterium]|nr:hypothetical protein [Clostridia bacterium]